MTGEIIVGILSLIVVILIAMSGFVYLIIKLVTNPLKESIIELKKEIEALRKVIKSESDLYNLIKLAIDEHEKNCPYNM